MKSRERKRETETETERETDYTLKAPRERGAYLHSNRIRITVYFSSVTTQARKLIEIFKMLKVK